MPTATDTQITPRLLIVDDELAVLKLVKALLNRHEYEVVTCQSGAEGLKLLNAGVFDCIITDALMPEMSGYDFVQAIRKQPQFANLPILMLTRKRHRQDVKKAVDSGVSDYVLKPIDEHLFLDKIELCLKKGSGKRHVFELPLTGPLSQGTVQLPCEVTSVSEADLTLWTQLPLPAEQEFTLRTKIFHEIGIDVPHMKLINCELISGSPERGTGYEIKFAFIGVAEEDLRKIRAWIQKEAIKRRN